MLESLQSLFSAHPVLWPALAIVAILFAFAYALRARRREPQNKRLFQLMVASFALGLLVVIVSQIDDPPSWFKKHSVLSALGICLILCAWGSYYFASRWVQQVTATLESEKRKEVNKLKDEISAKLGLKSKSS